jgi:hypothetical protein
LAETTSARVNGVAGPDSAASAGTLTDFRDGAWRFVTWNPSLPLRMPLLGLDLAGRFRLPFALIGALVGAMFVGVELRIVVVEVWQYCRSRGGGIER